MGKIRKRRIHLFSNEETHRTPPKRVNDDRESFFWKCNNVPRCVSWNRHQKCRRLFKYVEKELVFDLAKMFEKWPGSSFCGECY